MWHNNTRMYEQVLLTTDGSEAAEGATAHALAIAKQFDAELHVVSVIDTESISRPFEADQVDWLGTSSLDEIGDLRDAAQDSIQRIMDQGEAAGIDVVQTIGRGNPSRAISDYAMTNDIDLIVMGSRGHGTIRRLMVGSVTEQVTRIVSIPVLITDEQPPIQPPPDSPAQETDPDHPDSAQK